MFQKNKHGNIAILLLICMAIILIIGYMIQNVLQLNIERKVLKEDFQNQISISSIYEVCAEEVIELLDNKQFYLSDRVINESDLMYIKEEIYNYTGENVELSINSPTVSDLSVLSCIIKEHKVKIYNIEKEIIEINLNEEEVIEMIKLHMQNVKIEIVSENDE